MKERNRRKHREVLLTDYIRVGELAILFGISRWTISNWLKIGKLKSREVKDVIELYCEMQDIKNIQV